MYYDSGNEPVEALGRFARRVGSGGALYIGGGVGVEKVATPKGDRYQLTKATGKSGEEFAGPLSAVMRAFSTAGASTSADSPGGSTKVSDPAAAARLHELRDMERQTRKDIDRVQARLAAKVPAPVAGYPSPGAISDDSYEARRLAELKRDLTQIQAERAQLTSTGKVEEVEQVRPGTNFTKIPPQNVKRLSGIVQHYKGMAHGFTVCVRDQVKHGLSEDHAKRRCAVVTDLGAGTTKWRSGGKVKEAEARIEEAVDRVRALDEALGAGAAVELAEAAGSIGHNVLDAIGEGAFADLVVLAISGDPLGKVWEAVRGGTDIPDPLAEAFNEKLHPRAHGGPDGGRFVRKLFGAHDTSGKPGVLTPRHKDPIPEGSGPRRPSAPVRLGDTGPRAPGTGAEADLARQQKGVNQRKLTDKELPGSVGKGPWDAAVPETLKALRDPAAETEKLYRTPQGTYEPARIELHARIVRSLLQGAGAHPDDKRAVFLAGGPASGKSTLLKQGTVKPPADAVQINPDIVKTMLPEYKALVAAGDPAASSKVHEESAHIAALLLNLSIAREHHIVVDGVGNSGPNKFARKIQRAVDRRYHVEVHYATIPTEDAVKRAELRANDPKSDSYGRRVPVGYIRSSHSSVSDRFNTDVRHMAGVHVHVYDTTAKKTKRVYSRVAGERERILHRKGFEQFVAKGSETSGKVK